MSNHYLVVAKTGETLRFFSLTSNASPATLRKATCRILKARYGNRPIQFLVTSDIGEAALAQKSSSD